MNPHAFNRLHSLRMENTAAKYHLDDLRPRFERITQRHQNGTAPRAVVAFQLFQTPAPLAARLAALLHLEPGARVLDPSAGLGRLIDAVEIYHPGEVVAVEVSPQCAGELYRRNQEGFGMVIRQRDFLTCTPAEFGLFDAVAMNPPFHMRADIRHIEHARKFLKPGGRLAAICMDTEHRRAALQPLAATWDTIPEGGFSEAGTRVPVVLLTIQN